MQLHTVFSSPGPVEAEILREIEDGIVVRRTLVPPVVLRSFEGGKGEPLLLLHDRLHSASIWAPLLKPLAETHTVIAVDLPGLGQSSSPRFSGKSPNPMRDGLRFFLDPLVGLVRERGLESASIVGHSLGGLLALELALSGVMKPPRLALIAPLGLSQTMSPMARLFYHAKPERLVGLMGQRLFSQALSRFRGQALPPRLAALEAELLSELGGKASPARAFDALVPLTGPLYERTFDRAALAAQTLLVWGERDPVLPSSMAREAARRFERAQLEVLPGLGHAPHLEDRERVLPLLQAFLTS